MKIIGVALVILGIVGLVFGGIGYNRQTTILEVGGIKATATEHKTIPIGPIAGRRHRAPGDSTIAKNLRCRAYRPLLPRRRSAPA
jgi:hypothetical protein